MAGRKAKTVTTMTNDEALQIVIDLAEQNRCDEAEMPQEYARQCEACRIVVGLVSGADQRKLF